jgi:hypothetical protein
LNERILQFDHDTLTLRARLLGSLLEFTRIFFEIKNGKSFQLTQPAGNESHFITICRQLTRLFRGQAKRLLINCPPGWSKSELLKHFVAWSFAHHADCRFLYVSINHDLAARHTSDIKKIMELPAYKKLFGVEISADTAAKDHFATTEGGVIKAFGSLQTIVGYDAGLPGLDRFTGGLLIDDFHDPHDVHSDTMRESAIRNYSESLKPRLRGPNVPIGIIGQRLHQSDIFDYLKRGEDGEKWEQVILKGIDDVGNAANPMVHPLEKLRLMQKNEPYVFAGQIQQDPLPPGGGIFKQEWFFLMDDEPEILLTFITVDTAETNKSYNDATVFSFWGIYKIKQGPAETDLYGLHWINCVELRIEPKDLEQEFLNFYSGCMRHKVKPKYVAIEKKSTGVTLSSVLKNTRGMIVLNIERTKASHTKTDRYLEIQSYIAGGQISLPTYGRHTLLCLEHCKNITANNTHAYDDIADTLYDAVKIGLIESTILSKVPNSLNDNLKSYKVMENFLTLQRLKANQHGRI